MSKGDLTKEDLLAEVKTLQTRLAEIQSNEAPKQQIQAEFEDALLYAESILDTAHESLLVLDQDLRVVRVNAAFYRTFATTPDETRGQFIYDLGNRQWDIPQLRQFLERIIPYDTEVRNFEVRHVFQDIGPRIMLLNARRLSRGPRNKEVILLAINDITDRKRAEEAVEQYLKELARSNEELEQFAYVASHDLQEPLRMVSSYLKLLERRYKGRLDAEADKYIHYAVDGAARMRTLISDLLAYSRVGPGPRSNGHSGAFEPVDCEMVVARVAANLEGMIQDAGAAITCGRLPTVMADEPQLVQLFQNLIGNAIKFRQEDEAPRIHIEARYDDQGSWLFSVQDNGIGLDEAYADRVFVLFQRLHTRGEYSGNGIGLAICKKVIEHHGGRIWVKSHPGEGATFYFTLPLQQAVREEA